MMPKKLTLNGFIERAVLVHGSKYDYSFVNYKNMNTKIKILCSVHGKFEQLPGNHLYLSQGCPECGKKKQGPQVSTKEFIQKALLIHGDKYDYSLTNYTHSKVNIVIVCQKHGKFRQMPNCHLTGQGCPQCGIESRTDERRKSTDDFINESNFIHGYKYDYSCVVYTNNKEPVEIICLEHGVFLQSPQDHLTKGCGCPNCYKSIGEKSVEQTLINLGLEFESQVKFPDCKHIRQLPFDFCIKYEGKDYLIEYDGKQHFSSDSFFGGDEEFRKRRNRDKIKNRFARQSGKKLIRLQKKHINSMDDILEDLICNGGCWKVDDYVVII